MLNETSDITSAKCFMAGPARIRVQECVRSVLLFKFTAKSFFTVLATQSGLCKFVCWCERVCSCASVCVCVCARAVLVFTGEEVFGSGLPCYS